VIEPAFTELAPLVHTKRAWVLLGKPRATHYRRRRPRPNPPTRPRGRAHRTRSARPSANSSRVVLHEPRFCDLPPAQVWARLLDDGVYLASISTMYRLLRAQGESRDRRRQRTHPARVKPQLVATRPNDVWSWDITKLPGPDRGSFFDLYVILDIYSRYAPGWLVAPGESAELAERLIADTIARVGVAPGVVHADRGSSMTSKPVAQLLVDLGIVRSHSRPHVSDDNPYSEAQFKTLKYCPAFPERFGSVHDARAFCVAFFDAYNTNIGMPLSGCTPPPRSTTAPPARSASTAPSSSTRPTRPTQPGSLGRRHHHSCPPSPGSTNPPRRRSYRRDNRWMSHPP
jgi:putative transposase